MNMENNDENDIFEEEGVSVETSLPVKAEEPAEDESTMLSRLKITVGDPEKKTKNTGLKMQETFVVFLIETMPLEAESSSASEEVTSLWRRYSEFELLRNYLVVTYPAVIVPPLPEKRANFIWTKITATDTYDVEFLERRRVGLESFLHRISGHPKLSKDQYVKHFICKQEDWRDAILSTGFQSKADSWLKKTNASLRVKHPDLRLVCNLIFILASIFDENLSSPFAVLSCKLVILMLTCTLLLPAVSIPVSDMA